MVVELPRARGSSSEVAAGPGPEADREESPPLDTGDRSPSLGGSPGSSGGGGGGPAPLCIKLPAPTLNSLQDIVRALMDVRPLLGLPPWARSRAGPCHDAARAVGW